MRILLGTDGSGPAGIAVDLVAGIDWPQGTEIHVVQAIETGRGWFGGTWPAISLVDVEAFEADLRRGALATVKEARSRLERPELKVAAAVLVGRAASAIVEEAQAIAADLIVVGSRGQGTIGSMVLGSVSSEVVDHAPVPVLVARRPFLRRVVLAWDGSSCARVAADLVQTWPLFRSAAVRVVSVADLGIPWWTGFPAVGSPELVPMYIEAGEASRRLHADLAREMTKELAVAGIEATAETRQGAAAAEIIAAAAALDADLIVLGTHGRTGLRRLVLGTVARNVLHHTAASVLVARAAAAPSDDPGGGIA